VLQCDQISAPRALVYWDGTLMPPQVRSQLNAGNLFQDLGAECQREGALPRATRASCDKRT